MNLQETRQGTGKAGRAFCEEFRGEPEGSDTFNNLLDIPVISHFRFLQAKKTYLLTSKSCSSRRPHLVNNCPAIQVRYMVLILLTLYFPPSHILPPCPVHFTCDLKSSPPLPADIQVFIISSPDFCNSFLGWKARVLRWSALSKGQRN